MSCPETSTCSVELANLPTLTTCPADDEKMLFVGAVGGAGHYKYALRTWAKVKECITSGSGGYAAISATISANGTTYTNSSLIGATELLFVIINNQLYTYENGDFSFNDNVGTISFLTISLFIGDKITIPYSPA